MPIAIAENICQVCGKAEAIVSLKSRLLDKEFRCCPRCLKKHLEPYENIVEFLTACFVLGAPPCDLQKKKINYILNELHIDYNRFESDVHREVDEINQALLFVEKYPKEFVEMEE